MSTVTRTCTLAEVAGMLRLPEADVLPLLGALGIDVAFRERHTVTADEYSRLKEYYDWVVRERLEEVRLRTALQVGEEATANDILGLIDQEGFAARLVQGALGDGVVYACSVSSGIFSSCERNEATGQIGHRPSLTPALAALRALETAREWRSL